MAGCTVLAFLFCDKPSIDAEGKTRLDGIFDRILISPARTRTMPRFGRPPDRTEFFVFYKAAVDEPCQLSLRVFGPRHNEISEVLTDDIRQAGLVQSVWVLTTGLFVESGWYRFELWHNLLVPLVRANLAVEHAIR